MPQDLNQTIRQQMRRIKQNNIWAKARILLKEYGVNNDVEKPCYYITNEKLQIIFGGTELRIELGSSGQFHQNLHMKIFWDNQPVFEADTQDSYDDVDPRRIVSIDPSHKEYQAVVRVFTPGDWLKFINPARVKRELEKVEVKKRKAAEVKIEPQVRYDKDEILARDIGITTKP